MKRLFTPLLLFLTVLFGGINALAADEVKDLTADMFYQWDGYGADAKVKNLQPTGTENNLGIKGGQGFTIFGTTGVAGDIYADLTEYEGIEADGTPGKPVRLLFNRPTQDQGITEYTINFDSDGKFTFKFNQVKDGDSAASFIHLNAVKVGWGVEDGGCEITSMRLIPKPDPLELNASWFHQWDGFGADAQIIDESSTVSEDNIGVELSQGGQVFGPLSCNGDIYADLSKYGGIEGVATPGITLRFFFNRDALQGAGHPDTTVDTDSDGKFTLDFSNLGDMDFVHLNFVKIQEVWRGGKWPEGLDKAVVKSMKVIDPLAAAKGSLKEAISKAKLYDEYFKTADSWNALQKAIAEAEDAVAATDASDSSISTASSNLAEAFENLQLEEGYEYLTKEMFKTYGSVEEPGEGTNPGEGCDFEIFKSTGMPYGNSGVDYLRWADLKDYDKLIVTTNGSNGKPRFCMNRTSPNGQEDNGGMLDIAPGNGKASTANYLTVDGNIFAIDLNKMVNDCSYARLHSMKSVGGEVFVTGMYLFKDPNPLGIPKEHLAEAIENAKNCDSYLKSEESWNALQTAISEGEKELENEDATQESLEAATKAITAAIEGLKLQPGYSYLTSDIFKQYDSLEDPGDGTAINCNNITGTPTDTPYGDGGVYYLKWADLTNYDELIVKLSGDTKPRVMMNRAGHDLPDADNRKDSKMLEMHPDYTRWSTVAYTTYDTDTKIFTVKLKDIVDDYGFARLNAIKYPGGQQGVVTGIYLYKDAAEEFNLSFDIDDPSHVVVKVGDEIQNLKAGNNEVMVANRAKLSIAPADKFKISSLTANDEEVALADGAYSKIIVKPISFKIVTEDANPLAPQIKELNALIENAKLYDDFLKTKESWDALQAAITAAEAEAVNGEATAESLEKANSELVAAINGLALVEDYYNLSPEMYKKYASLAEPSDGEPSECLHVLFEETDKAYGNPDNSELEWADLSEYDSLIIKTYGNDTKPLVSLNRLEANGEQAETPEESKMIEINPFVNDYKWSTEKYQKIEDNSDGDNKAYTYTIDLKQIVKDFGFARLHSIKKSGWNTMNPSISGMYLYKDPNPTVDLAFNIDDPAHVVIKVNEEAIEGLEVGDNVKSVAFRGELSIAPAEGFVITKLTADGEDVELTEGAYTTTILKEVSYKIETFDPNAKVLFNVNFDIDDASHVVITANGEKLEELVDGSNDIELEENTEVSIAAAEGFLLKSVMAGEAEVELIDGMYTTTITEPVSYTIVTEVYDPLEQPREELNANIERAKLYDAFAKTAESFDALQAAIEAAEAALKAEDATVESITAANENIDAAVKGLELEEGYAYLTAEMFKSYDSVEEPGEGSDAGCAYDLFKVVSTPYGDGNVSEKNWADLTAFDKLILTMGDTKAPRVMMNRMEKEGADADSKEASKMLDMQPGSQRWSTKEYTVYDSENNVFTVDLRKIVNAYGFARLNAIKYPWSDDGAANGMITGMYLYTSNDDLEIPLETLTEAINKAELCDDFLKTEETWNALQTAIADGKAKLAEVRPTVESVEEATAKINAAIDGLALQDGYSELTKEMFKKYKSVEEPGEGEATSCDYNLQTETGKPYGDCINVNHLNWADLTGYDKLILKANSGTPRFCMNRLADGGQQKATMEESLMVDMHAGYDDWSSNRYLESDGDVYTVDLCKLIDDYGFARLHAIKFDGYVTGMYLYKDPVSNKEFTLTFDIDDPTHVVIEVNGEKINDLKAGANEKKVADRSKLSIAPAESFKLTSVTANGESLTLKEGMLVKTIVKDFTFQIVTEDADPLAQPKKALTATIESAKYYDSFAKTEDSFATLTKAIADAEAALTAEDATEDSLTEASDNISKAIEGLTLAEGYSYLTAEMFKKYASVAEPGEGEPTDCAYEIFNTSRMLYGASNDNLKWADLTDYDQLILTTAGSGDLPRFCLNSTTIEINPYDSSDSAATEEYQTIEDNRYVIDVKKIVKDYEFAHLNSIQVNGWGTGTFVTGMYLYKAPYVAVTGFTLDKTEAEMTVGETMTLKATVAPANATDSDVVWSSSNVKVACVDENGNVTALKVGKVTITASCGDFSAECAVKCHTTLGDANWDGKITVTDAVHISNYVVQDYTVPEDWTEAEWKEFYEKGANANGDDRISFADATATVKLALDQESSASTQTRIIAAENEQADALVIGRVSDASLSNVTVPVSLDNSMEYVALQADIILPEGMSVEVKAGGRVADSHTLLTKKFADNHIRVALFNLGNAAFADCQAPILEIVADSNLLDADDIVISNIYASDAHANEYELASRSGEVSGVAGVAGGDIVISKVAGGVVISNAAGSNVWIYTLDGNAVKTLVAKDNVETIDLAAGVYVVKVGDKTLKVVL